MNRITQLTRACTSYTMRDQMITDQMRKLCGEIASMKKPYMTEDEIRQWAIRLVSDVVNARD